MRSGKPGGSELFRRSKIAASTYLLDLGYLNLSPTASAGLAHMQFEPMKQEFGQSTSPSLFRSAAAQNTEARAPANEHT